MEYAELFAEVSKWVRHNGLRKVDPYKQYSNLMVVQAELGEAVRHPIPKEYVEEYGFGDIETIMGNYQIQLIIYCLARGLKFKPSVKKAVEKAVETGLELDDEDGLYEDESAQDRFMELINSSARIIESYTKNSGERVELSDIFDTMYRLHNLTKKYSTSLESSLEKAFRKIKEREMEKD